MTRALRIVQRNVMVYRHVWRGSLFMSFLHPALFLVAMGIGLGGLIDADSAGLPGGASYLAFLGPGLLASTCMQTANFESSFPIHGKMTWRRNYDAILATPLGVADVLAGELAWVAARLVMVATAFAIVLAACGAGPLLRLLGAVPAAVLTGLAIAAPIMAYAATLREGGNFNVVYRFILTPLFLFSGVFFPVSRLPAGLQAVAAATPLYHGVEITRGLVLGTLAWPAAAGHVAYLAGLLACGTAGALWTFTRRLRT